MVTSNRKGLSQPRKEWFICLFDLVMFMSDNSINSMGLQPNKRMLQVGFFKKKPMKRSAAV